MHSSKGTGLSAGQMLHMTPPEVLRFLIMKNQPSKHIAFDPGFGLLSFVDEYDQFERMYFGDQEQIKGAKDIDALYELSQPYKIPRKLPVQVPYRHLVTLIQIQDDWNELIVVGKGSRLIQKINGVVFADLTDEDAEHAMSAGVLAFQDHAHGTIVGFKDIWLKRPAE